MRLTFNDFAKRSTDARGNPTLTATKSAAKIMGKLKGDLTVKVTKHDEDPDLGYFYSIEVHIGAFSSYALAFGRWYTGFGTGGENDVLDAINSHHLVSCAEG